MYDLTRGISTLLGVAMAGGLLWLASWIGPRDSVGDYWIAMGIVAGAGLVLAVSQLVGGWTKYGLPRVSGGVLLLGFLPALILGGWVLIAAQPSTNEARNYITDWSSDIGISDIVADVTPIVGAIALALGVVFGFIFDTTGPRDRAVVDDDRDVYHDRDARYADRDRYAADEPVAADRERSYDGERTQEGDRTYSDGRDGDRTYETDTGERAVREPAAVGTRDESATPSAPQPEPESEPRRRSFFRR
jgi:hypothetical protein